MVYWKYQCRKRCSALVSFYPADALSAQFKISERGN